MKGGRQGEMRREKEIDKGKGGWSSSDPFVFVGGGQHRFQTVGRRSSSLQRCLAMRRCMAAAARADDPSCSLTTVLRTTREKAACNVYLFMYVCK